jgi:putative hemolysin
MLALIYLSGWFSSTETALTNLNLIDILNLNKKDKRIKYVKKLKKNLNLSIISILILNNIVNVLLSVLPVIILGVYLDEFVIGILITVITLIIILFGDIIPKSKAISNKNRIMLKNAKIMYYLFILTKPLVMILIYISNLFNKKSQSAVLIDDKIIKEITHLSHKNGSIKEIEAEMISNILLFGDLKIRDIMVKKINVFFLSKNYTLDEARKILSKRPFTRIPYVENNRVVGILYAKDLLNSKRTHIFSLLKKPFILNEDEDITYVLKHMKKRRIHLGIINDTLGNFKGVVTLEDIIEVIVGDIKDEYSKEKYP